VLEPFTVDKNVTVAANGIEIIDIFSDDYVLFVHGLSILGSHVFRTILRSKNSFTNKRIKYRDVTDGKQELVQKHSEAIWVGKNQNLEVRLVDQSGSENNIQITGKAFRILV